MLSPYLWVSGIASSVETASGRLDVDKSGGDILSTLDLAFMGTFEARRVGFVLGCRSLYRSGRDVQQ